MALLISGDMSQHMTPGTRPLPDSRLTVYGLETGLFGDGKKIKKKQNKQKKGVEAQLIVSSALQWYNVETATIAN